MIYSKTLTVRKSKQRDKKIDEELKILRGASYKLAMYVLQSKLYQSSIDVREAADNVLTLTKDKVL